MKMNRVPKYFIRSHYLVCMKYTYLRKRAVCFMLYTQFKYQSPDQCIPSVQHNGSTINIARKRLKLIAWSNSRNTQIDIRKYINDKIPILAGRKYTQGQSL